MSRAREAGLRPGWRGHVAYLFSPWLWRAGPFWVWIVVMVALFAAQVGGVPFRDHHGMWGSWAFDLTISTLFGLLFFLNPALRAVDRRLKWRNGTPDAVVDGTGGWLGRWRR
jgi:hypothetical protein